MKFDFWLALPMNPKPLLSLPSPLHPMERRGWPQAGRGVVQGFNARIRSGNSHPDLLPLGEGTAAVAFRLCKYLLQIHRAIFREKEYASPSPWGEVQDEGVHLTH